MPHDEIKQALKELHLSDKEIEVYLALLLRGTQGAMSIAKQARLNRITVYHLLDALMDKGLVSHVIKSGVKYFQAADPRAIHRMIKEKEERFAKVLPMLEKMKESVLEHPRVEVYDGKEGLKSIMDDWINTGKDIVGIGSEELDAIIGFYFPHHIMRRVKAGIRIRLLFGKSRYAQEMKRKDKRELRETKMLDCGKLTTGVYAYGNKVSFLTFVKEEPRGLIIEDASIVNTVKTMLELLWTTTR